MNKLLKICLAILAIVFLISVVLHYKANDQKTIKVFEEIMVGSASAIGGLLIGFLQKQNNKPN